MFCSCSMSSHMGACSEAGAARKLRRGVEGWGGKEYASRFGKGNRSELVSDDSTCTARSRFCISCGTFLLLYTPAVPSMLGSGTARSQRIPFGTMASSRMLSILAGIQSPAGA